MRRVEDGSEALCGEEQYGAGRQNQGNRLEKNKGIDTSIGT